MSNGDKCSLKTLPGICDELCEDYSPFLFCPFCHDTDFDLIGLKSHLDHGDCDVYNNTEYLQRIG